MVKLFDKDARVFTTLGIGVLTDVISIDITDERNGEFELEMTYPITGNLYNEIDLKKIIVTKANLTYKNDQAFRIYYISKPLNGIVTINARHISYDLSNFIVKPFEATNPKEVIEGIQNGLEYLGEETANIFTFETNYIEEQVSNESDADESEDEKKEDKMKVNTPTSVRSVLGGDGGLLETFGGDLEFDNFTVRHYCKENPRGKNRGFEIRYGHNMTSLEHKKEVINDFTAIYPYYAKKSTDAESLTENKYKPVYITKGVGDKDRYTRNWLTLEDGSDVALNPEKDLATGGSSYISPAIQIKTPGEFKDRLFVYISEKLLNNVNNASNGLIDGITNVVSSIIRVFNFVPVDWNKETYTPNNYYYVQEYIQINLKEETFQPNVYYYKDTNDNYILASEWDSTKVYFRKVDLSTELEKCTFILDTSNSMDPSKHYYNAILKGTNDVLAGHYYPVPKYGYVSRIGTDVHPSTEGIEIDEDPNNTGSWLSYDLNGEPISTALVNKFMRALPIQIQNGNAAGKMVIYDPFSDKYKELKNGIEKTFPVTTTESEEIVDIFELKKYNDITMDADKIKDGTPYFYSTSEYTEVTVTSESYESNKYYYESVTEYIQAYVSESTYKKGVYYVCNKVDNETVYEIYNGDWSSTKPLFYKKIKYAIDDSSEYTEGRTYYSKDDTYITIFKLVQIDASEYEPNKYYYPENTANIPYYRWKMLLDTSETFTDGRGYYKILVCEKVYKPIYNENYEANKYYKLVNNEFVLTNAFESGVKYYECNDAEDQYRSTVDYFSYCPDAPLIYIDEHNKDNTKVLSVDLSDKIEGEPTADDLLARANDYLKTNSEDFDKIDDSVTTDFVRLSDTIGYDFLGDIEQIQNGDTVRVVNVMLDIDRELQITSLKFDPLNNTYSDIELGKKEEKLSDTVLTSGSDISSLKNSEGYVNRAEVKKLIVDTLDAKNINVTGLLEATRAVIQEMVVTTLQVTDLNANRIVAGTIGAEDVTITSKIEVRGYNRLDNIHDEESYNQYAGTELYYKVYKYDSYTKDDDGFGFKEGYKEERTYYSKGETVFKVDDEGHLTANSADIKGTITATSGIIGGCIIENNKLIVESANISSLSADLLNGYSIELFNNIKDNKNIYASDSRVDDVVDYVDNISDSVDTLEDDTAGLVAYTKIQGVHIDGDGFRVVNSNNITVFNLTPEGNLTLTGNITATSGSFGSYNISEGGTSFVGDSYIYATYMNSDAEEYSHMMSVNGTSYIYNYICTTYIGNSSNIKGIVSTKMSVDFKQKNRIVNHQLNVGDGTFPLLSSGFEQNEGSQDTNEVSLYFPTDEYNYKYTFITTCELTLGNNSLGQIYLRNPRTLEPIRTYDIVSVMACEKYNGNKSTTGNVIVEIDNNNHMVTVRHANTHTIKVIVWLYLQLK